MSDKTEINPDKLESIWYSCFPKFEAVVDKVTYETVLKNVKPVLLDNENVELRIPRAWQRDHLVKFIIPISEIFDEYIGKKLKFSVSVRNGDMPAAVLQDKKMDSEKTYTPEPGTENKKHQNGTQPYTYRGESENPLDPKYTFDNFIIGNGNRFAAAAAQAVAEAPANAYNPLFIYGGVGLGKTHLINAIGNLALASNPEAKVVYVSAEKFTNDMIESLGDKKMKEFRRKYRNVDVLLIDDIQFIKNKEAIQEEFFHTFNELHSAKAQIVITSDRPPKDIPTLEDRLRSRFEWGLIADISAPDLETRMAILKKKADVEGVSVPNEVISYIAEIVPSNIRELEGALNRVICYSSLMNLPVDMEITMSALKNIVPDTKPKYLTIKFIQEKVCEYYNIRIDELIGKCRDSRLVMPRQVSMFLSKELIGSSFPSIGNSFGGRDHTTVMHACRKIAKIQRDPSLKNDLENIKNMLKTSGG